MSGSDVVVPGHSGRVFLYVVCISEDGCVAIVRDRAGFEFVVPAVLPEFLGDTIKLRGGQNISAVLVGQTGLTDALVEDGLEERREFESARQDAPFWIHGIATGSGFKKQ